MTSRDSKQKKNYISKKNNKQIKIVSTLVKDKWDILLLLLLCLTIFISHTLYILKTFQFPHEDEPLYLDTAIKLYKNFTSLSIDRIFQITQIMPDRQPLYPLSISFALLIFGINNVYKIGLFVNYFFYATTIVAIYFLAKEFINKTASFFASFIFAFYGFPLFYLHFTYSETATTSFVVLSLLFLAKSRNFSIQKYTILFSIFFLLGCLTRWVAPIFVSGPLFLSLVLAIKNQASKKTRDTKNFFTNILIFFSIGILLPLLVYYIPNFSYFKQYVINNRELAPVWVTQLDRLPPGLSNPFSVRSIMYYINILSQQTIFFFALFSAGVLLSLIYIRRFAFLLIGFFISYAVFTFGSIYKADRFIVPIYPYMAILSAVVIDCLQEYKRIKFCLLIAILILGTLNFLGASWGIGPMGKRGLKDVVLPSFIHHPRRIYLTTMVWPPRQDEMHIYNFFDAIEKDFHGISRPAVLLNTYSFHPQELDNAIGSVIYFENIKSVQASHLRVIRRGDYDDLFMRIRNADYILVKDKGLVDSSAISQASTDAMVDYFNQAIEREETVFDAYSPLKEVYIPLFKRSLRLLKKERAILDQEWEVFANTLADIDPEYSQNIEGALEKIRRK